MILPPLLGRKCGNPYQASSTKTATLSAHADLLSPSSFLGRRDPSTTLSSASLSPRSNNIVWCAPGSNTYVMLDMIRSLPSSGVIDLLDEVQNALHDHIRKLGDGVLTGGMFQWATNTGYVLQAWSSNNHQTTWGVLGAAVTALFNYMTAGNIYGAVGFRIYDGLNEVGGGQIGRG